MAAVGALQLLSRGLVGGAALLIAIMCTEQLPAATRAWAIGLMSLAGGLGVGIVLWFVPFLDAAPWVWRLEYAGCAVAGVIALGTLRGVGETDLFVHHAEAGAVLPRRTHLHLGRLIALGAVLFLLNVFVGPTQQLQADYLRVVHHYSGLKLALFMIGTNTWGFLGVAAGAVMADRRSRRLTAAAGLIGLAIGNGAMFATGGAPMWVASLLGSLLGALVIPSIGAAMPELFATLRRGVSNGILNAVAVVGGAVGLLVVGTNIGGTDYRSVILPLALAPILGAAALMALPESAGASLEALNDDAIPGAGRPAADSTRPLPCPSGDPSTSSGNTPRPR
ncbi:MAG: hypothetical protein R2698_09300 [Microthrixaceae bacterium]